MSVKVMTKFRIKKINDLYYVVQKKGFLSWRNYAGMRFDTWLEASRFLDDCK